MVSVVLYSAIDTSFRETERRVARGEVSTRSNSRLAASTRVFPPYLQRLLAPAGLRRFSSPSP